MAESIRLQYFKDIGTKGGEIVQDTDAGYLSLRDILHLQHMTGDNLDKRLYLYQTKLRVVGMCQSPADVSEKTAAPLNFPDDMDFSKTPKALLGMSCDILFKYGNTFGSAAAGTYPTLTLFGVKAPLYDQGKPLEGGTIEAGQIVAVTLRNDGDMLSWTVGSASSYMRNGVLPPEHGGTGETSLKAAGKAVIDSLDSGTDEPSDDDYYVGQHTNGGEADTSPVKKPVSKLWEYIKKKISDVLGLTAASYGGKAKSAESADSATKALRDGDGKPIADTYATKAALDDKAPKAHASTDTAYGTGTGSDYGHVRLSDSTSSTSAAASGIAATPAAVKAAMDNAEARLPKNGTAAAALKVSRLNLPTGAGKVILLEASGSTDGFTLAWSPGNDAGDLVLTMTDDANSQFRIVQNGAQVLQAINGSCSINGNAGTATTANRIRTSAPSSPVDGDIWLG